MGWPGFIPIEPAVVFTGPLIAGELTAATLEHVPAGGDVPRPNEHWWLTSVFCPFCVLVVPTATPASQAFVTLTLERGGVPVFLEQFVLPLLPFGMQDLVGNQQATGDLTNPIEYYSGESPLNLNMAVSVDKDVQDVHLHAGQQISITSEGPPTQARVPAPGRITYQAVSMTELQAIGR